jgi:anthranilate phosphoribosyltransferase
MDLQAVIKEIGRGAHGARALAEDQACDLFGAMLDGKVGDLELGAILLAYRIKGEDVLELRGFERALRARAARMEPPSDQQKSPLPVLLPCYNGARKLPNLTPLLALLLARQGIPVLLHGVRADFGRVTTEAILAKLGLPTCASTQVAQARLRDADPARRIAYLPLALLSPGLDRLLAARERIGLRGSGHTVAKLVDPFGGRSVLVIPVTHPDYITLMRHYLITTPTPALLLRGHEGEPCAGPRRPLEVDYFCGGEQRLLTEERPPEVPLPDSLDAATTAKWTRQALAGEVEIPRTVLIFAEWCALAASGKLLRA